MSREPIHAILLAAGVSRRLRGTVDDRPKCLLEFGKRTLLDRHLAALVHYGVPRVTIVTGYREGMIESALAGTRGIEVRTARNDRFEEGSILSLGIGLAEVRKGEAALVMDADVLYEPGVLGRLVESGDGFLLDETSAQSGEEMMLGARGGKVVAIARSLCAPYDDAGEGVGFFLCPANRVGILRRVIDETIARGGTRQEYEAALDIFVREHPAGYRRVGDLRWTEIDFAADIEHAARDVLPVVEARERELGIGGTRNRREDARVPGKDDPPRSARRSGGVSGAS